MKLPTLKDLLEAGAHFGHDPSRWNPKMAPYIFGVRSGVHIIDLEQTVAALEQAAVFARDVAARGGTLLFVGTKRQARSIVRAEAGRCGMPYVTTRWLGGTLTNFPTIQKSIEKRALLASKLASPEARLLTKKDRQKMGKEVERLDAVLEGLKELRALPDAVVLVGAHDEKLAVKEAQRTGVPVVALVDTNADPSAISYAIPANDDAVGSLQKIVAALADAVIEGKAARPPAQETPPPAAVAGPSKERTKGAEASAVRAGEAEAPAGGGGTVGLL